MQKWTEETIREAALKYKTKAEFRRNNIHAYAAAHTRGIINSVCAHMSKSMSKRTGLTEQLLREIALKYETKKQFRHDDSSTYQWARRKGLLDSVCGHMKPRTWNNRPKQWTEQLLRDMALKYKSRSEFKYDNSSAYRWAMEKGLLDSICSHMERHGQPGGRREKGTWTEQQLKDVALKYKTRAEFQKHSASAYQAAWKMGLLDVVCTHMMSRRRKLTVQVLKEIMLQYKSRAEFENEDQSAFEAAKRKGIIDSILPRKLNRFTVQDIKERALRYNSRSEFAYKDPHAYKAALGRGILNSVCTHMKKLRFSTPQLICQQLFDQLLEANSSYDNRKIIRPYELDIYYKQFNFAVEYQGSYWHKNEKRKDIDLKKRNLCKEKGIFLFTINEAKRVKRYKYEEDIKARIIESLRSINDACGINLTKDAVLNTRVDYDKLFCLYDEKQIKAEIMESKSVSEFINKHKRHYYILCSLKKLDLLDPIRKQLRHQYTEEKIRELAKGFTSRNEFIKAHSRACVVAKKLGIWDGLIPRKYARHQYTEEKIRELAKGFVLRSKFAKAHSRAYVVAKSLGIWDSLIPRKRRVLSNVTGEQVSEPARIVALNPVGEQISS